MSCWSTGDSLPSNQTIGIYQALERFNAAYKDAHSYLSISVCVCGILLNVANVVVLTRPAMASNPINALLTIIALSDASVMTSYIPFAVWSRGVFSYCDSHWQTYAWACFVLFNSCLTVICHAVSIWLTVAMALIRAVTVRRKNFASVWTTRDSYLLALAMFIVTLIIYVPGLISYRVASREFDFEYCQNDNPNENEETVELENSTRPPRLIYITTVSELGYANQCILLKSAFWINGVLFKMIPCVLLSVFIGVLLHILTQVKQRKTRLRSGSKLGNTSAGHTPAVNGRRSSQDRSTDRTTLMLVVLLAVFLAAELPQGLLLVSTGLASYEFRTRVFMNLGTLTDLLSLLNSAVNFVIYCAMSQKFREVFAQTILPSFLRYGCFRDSLRVNGGPATVSAKNTNVGRANQANIEEISSTTYTKLQQRKQSIGRTKNGRNIECEIRMDPEESSALVMGQQSTAIIGKMS